MDASLRELWQSLFLIFINNVPDNISSRLAIYADGANIYSCFNIMSDRFDDTNWQLIKKTTFNRFINRAGNDLLFLTLWKRNCAIINNRRMLFLPLAWLMLTSKWVNRCTFVISHFKSTWRGIIMLNQLPSLLLG